VGLPEHPVVVEPMEQWKDEASKTKEIVAILIHLLGAMAATTIVSVELAR
jgi:hypothetical protein